MHLSRPPRSTTALRLAGLLASALLAAPALAADTPAPIAWTAARIEAAGVRTQQLSAGAGQAGAGLVLQGQVELPPQATELLSSPLAGVVQQVLVAPGQRVKAGEVVARLTSPELLSWQRELLQAQSQARLAASKLARDEQLYAEGIIPGQRLQDSRAASEQAQLALQERRQALQALGLAGGALQAQLALRAAAAGTVLELSALPGQRLEAGMPVARIARSGQLALVLQATPEQAGRLRVGDTLSIAGCTSPARLTAITPQLNSANQSVQLRADFTAAEDCLRLQQFVQATVQAAPAQAGAATTLSVPAQAVVRQEGKAYVFVRTHQGFVPTAVELGPQGNGAWQVRSGLKAGDEVAVSGTAALKGAWLGLGSEGK
ncbi:efflux RND transporter periplasmic adaptor subunit [Alicycliphilus denitrificans]|uniref:efflux RND transporter periplasmic adaptor subunit n=1 Tax=Alicycliphilus denitrificans TaxID=179636 RepID=UPI00384F603E